MLSQSQRFPGTDDARLRAVLALPKTQEAVEAELKKYTTK